MARPTARIPEQVEWALDALCRLAPGVQPILSFRSSLHESYAGFCALTAVLNEACMRAMLICCGRAA